MHTFRKLPKSRPTRNPVSSKRKGEGTVEVYGRPPPAGFATSFPQLSLDTGDKLTIEEAGFSVVPEHTPGRT